MLKNTPYYSQKLPFANSLNGLKNRFFNSALPELSIDNGAAIHCSPTYFAEPTSKNCLQFIVLREIFYRTARSACRLITRQHNKNIT